MLHLFLKNNIFIGFKETSFKTKLYLLCKYVLGHFKLFFSRVT